MAFFNYINLNCLIKSKIRGKSIGKIYFKLTYLNKKSIDMFKEICIIKIRKGVEAKKSCYKSCEWYEVWRHTTDSLTKNKILTN